MAELPHVNLAQQAARRRTVHLTDAGRAAIGAAGPTREVPLLALPWRDDRPRTEGADRG